MTLPLLEDDFFRARPEGAEAMRRALYEGAIFKLPKSAASLALAARARASLHAHFGDEETARAAHARMTTADFLARLTAIRAELRTPPFRAAVRDVMAEVGFAAEGHAVDDLRLRGILHRGHEAPAAAPVYFAHRDTWYGNPQAQINWWLALHDVDATETFAFYPDRFAEPVENTSSAFDYATWIRTVGWQATPGARATYPSATGDLRGLRKVPFACAMGELVVFAGAHLHQTLELASGRTRYSLDWRSVHVADHRAGRGAPNIDNRSTGSAFDDYTRPDDASSGEDAPPR